LKTRAERSGDHYVVNGQKTWNTLGQHADMIFCLVRTASGSKKQEGISFLLIDMHSPGVTVRPIITIDGGHEVNEVWFDNVEVPVENLVGEEGRGWSYAKFLLSHERSGIAGVSNSKRELRYLKHIAAQEQKDGRPLIEDPRFRDKVARLEIDLMALEQARQGECPGRGDKDSEAAQAWVCREEQRCYLGFVAEFRQEDGHKNGPQPHHGFLSC
jgi:alkylation response protein AidB-like acyl-CoA dehydrogenase